MASRFSLASTRRWPTWRRPSRPVLTGARGHSGPKSRRSANPHVRSSVPSGEAREREDRRHDDDDRNHPIPATCRVVRHGRIGEERSGYLDHRAKHVAFLARQMREATSAIPRPAAPAAIAAIAALGRATQSPIRGRSAARTPTKPTPTKAFPGSCGSRTRSSRPRRCRPTNSRRKRIAEADLPQTPKPGRSSRLDGGGSPGSRPAAFGQKSGPAKIAQ